MRKKKPFGERLLMRDVYKEVMERTWIGREIVVDGGSNAWRDYNYGAYRKVRIEGYYPGFVLTVDGSGLCECFSYYDVWRNLYKRI